MQQSGRAYAILRSQDGNGGRDERIEDPIAFVDSIESGLIPPSHPRYSLRDKVLTFFVNRAPYLLRDIPTFEPRPCTPADPTGCVYYDRRINLSLNLVRDDDPRAAGAGREVGGIPASANPDFVYRFSVMIRGRRTGSNPPRDTVFVPLGLGREVGRNQFTPVDIPSFLQGPELSVEIEVCDCRDCETSPGQGRCRRYPPINVIIPQLSPQEIAAEAAALAGPNSATRPGSTAATSRSRTP